MRATQGCFYFLRDLKERELRLLIDYGLSRRMGVAVEYTKDPKARNRYWYMWGLPKFEALNAAAILHEIEGCQRTRLNYGLSRGNFLRMKLPSEEGELRDLNELTEFLETAFEAVAIGAALVDEVLPGKVSNEGLLDVVPLTLGVALEGNPGRDLERVEKSALLSRARNAAERLAEEGGVEENTLLRDLETACKAEELGVVFDLLLRLYRIHPIDEVLLKGWERGGA